MSKVHFLIKAMLHGSLVCVLMAGSASISAQTPKWTPPAALNSYATEDSGSDQVDPQLATDGEGNWGAVWESQYGVFAAHSSNMGATWTAAVSLDSSKRTTDLQETCVVYAGSDTWVALWSNRESDGETVETNLMVARSVDGHTWSAPVAVNPAGTQAGSVLDMDSDGNGTVVATIGTQIMQSTDFGQTWSATDTNLPASVLIRGAKVAYAKDGKWAHAVGSMTNVFDANSYTLKVRLSTDNGATWSSPETISASARLLALDARGETIVMATSISASPIQSFLHIITSVDGGNTWSSKMQNEQLGGLEGSVFSLDVDEDGNWLLLGDRVTDFPTSWNQNIIAMHSTDPANQWTPFEPIVSEGVADEVNASVASDGNGGYVIVFQFADPEASPLEADYDIKAVHSLDTGTTWTTSVFVNSGALTDLPRIDDTSVRITMGENGTALAVWHYGNRGSSLQVMWARTDDYGQTWSNTAPILPDVSQVYEPELYYRGNGKWFVWWFTSPRAKFSMSNDDGFTWTAPDTFFGYTAADSGSAHGTMVKAHMAGGTPEQYGLARLEQGAQFWNEPTIVSDKPGAIAHSTGQQWFSLTYSNQQSGFHFPPTGVYTSTDDSRTWVKNTSTNQPLSGAQLVSDHAGTVVAVWSLRISTETEESSKIYVSKTTDNGLSWTAPEEIVEIPYWNGNARGAYAGAAQWIVVWDARENADDPWEDSRIMASISRDNGVTWSAPQLITNDGQLPTDAGQANPDVAASEGKVVVAWETAHPYVGNTDDTDLYYTFGLLNPPPTAARDWQLFE